MTIVDDRSVYYIYIYIYYYRYNLILMQVDCFLQLVLGHFTKEQKYMVCGYKIIFYVHKSNVSPRAQTFFKILLT